MTYSSNGGDQYELVKSSHSNALKNGTVTFGKLVYANDTSPITVRIRRNVGSGNEYCTFEVMLQQTGVSDISTDTIEKALQGTWTLADNKFVFDSGKIKISGGGNALSGTYEIDTDNSSVIAHIKTDDGQTLKITMPYTYQDGKFLLYNNRNEKLTKK